MATELHPIEILAGVQPSTDMTGQATPHYISADKIRFVDGLPEKLGGWLKLSYSDNLIYLGTPRNIFSYILNNTSYYLVASSTSLYSLVGNLKKNVTPSQTAGKTLTNPFLTYYATLGANPIQTFVGTGTITVTDASHKLIVGDRVLLSGATTTNGISNTLLNAVQIITSTTTNTYTFIVAGTASSSGAGGGSAVIRSSQLVTVTYNAHGFSNGYNISVTNATAFGGILAIDINSYFQIRNVTTNSFDIITDRFATSSNTGGGTCIIYPQISVGYTDATLYSGYGAGLYGAGLYGADLTGTAYTTPRIWSFDRFGDLVVFTAGAQTALYSWDSNIAALPQIVANSPSSINYCFVTDNIIMTLGANNVANRLQWCDQGNYTVWAETAQNQAGQLDVRGAGQFISHAPLKGLNLIFTRKAVYSVRYIGKPYVFEVKYLDAKGLIAPNARVSIDGVAYWMGNDNFYMYRGGSVEVIPSNTTHETTLKKYIFQNLTTTQREKIYCWFNTRFNEIWWHYPSASSNECDRVARFNIKDMTWVNDTSVRTAAEYPTQVGDYPYLANSDGSIYLHENGYNDDTNALPFSISTKYFTSGLNNTEILGIIPDNIQTTGDITLTVNTKLFPQDTATTTNSFTLSTAYQKASPRIQNRFWKYSISGNVLNQFWRAGQWYEEIQKGTKR